MGERTEGRVSALSRRKGAGAELEVTRLLRDAGWPHARRVFDSGSSGGGDVQGPPGVVFEVKRTERLKIWEAIEQAEAGATNRELPVVAFRRNRSGWYAALPLDELLALLRLREA